MSSNPQEELWFSDKVFANISPSSPAHPGLTIAPSPPDQSPQPEPAFRRPAWIQAKKAHIPDDWEDDDGGDEGQTEPMPSTLSQAAADNVPAQPSHGKKEHIEPTVCVPNVYTIVTSDYYKPVLNKLPALLPPLWRAR